MQHRLFHALSAAEDSVSRLEGRLAGSPLRQGWAERADFLEAAAFAWNQGEIVPLGELLLHDAMMDIRAPNLATIAAHAMLRVRRKILRTRPAKLLNWTGLADVLGPGLARQTPFDMGLARRIPDDPPPRPVLLDHSTYDFLAAIDLASNGLTDDPQALFALWSDRLTTVARDWPALLTGALLLDVWMRLDPLPRQPYLGPLLIEAFMRREHRLRYSRLHLELGRRLAAIENVRWREHDTALSRVTTCLTIIARGAQAGADELDRMTIAQQMLAMHLKGRRSTSKLPQLVELLLKSPMVTAAAAAKTLRISPQAVRDMISELGGAVQEVTGRTHYRAWRA